MAILDNGGVAVRDSKNRSSAPLVFSTAEWEVFVSAVKAGEFDTR
jgi:hypothetical protein